MNIRDLQVLITGGGRGLGRHFAVDLASRGASVGVCDVLEADLSELQGFAAGHNLAIDTYKTDVTSEQDVLDLFQAFLEKHGRVDVLINNAGITRDAFLVREKGGEIRKMSLEQWKMVIDINLTGVFLCGREAAASMVERKTKGLIINISSISRWGNMGQTNYSASKAGVVAMTVTWAKELAPYGIRCAAIAPGYTATEMVASMKPEIVEKVVEGIPLKRLADMEEIAKSALFIIENDYFDGRVLEVDGAIRI